MTSLTGVSPKAQHAEQTEKRRAVKGQSSQGFWGGALTCTVLCFVGVIFKQHRIRLRCLCQFRPWYGGECEKPGSGPRQGKHSGQGRDCVFKTDSRVYVSARVSRRNDVSHESRHLTNKPRADTLNWPNHPQNEKTGRDQAGVLRCSRPCLSLNRSRHSTSL